MKKWKTNYLIDAGLFLCMMTIAGIGLLMKYVVLTGRETNEIYGSDVELTFLGLDRHQWGGTHFIVSLVFLGLLTLHIILHWNMIACYFRTILTTRRMRYLVGYGFLLASIVLIGFPIIASPGFEEKEPLRRFADVDSVDSSLRRGMRHQASDTLAAEEAGQETGHIRELDIQGYMTVREVARRYGVPEDYILKELGISERGAAAERLGQLRRKHDFTMSTVEEVIQQYNREPPPL